MSPLEGLLRLLGGVFLGGFIVYSNRLKICPMYLKNKNS